MKSDVFVSSFRLPTLLRSPAPFAESSFEIVVPFFRLPQQSLELLCAVDIGEQGVTIDVRVVEEAAFNRFSQVVQRAASLSPARA